MLKHGKMLVYIAKISTLCTLKKGYMTWFTLKLWKISIKIFSLTHWDWVTHICVGKLTIIGSYNGMSPGMCQAIIWTNAGILLIGPSGTNFSDILIRIQTFSFKEIHMKIMVVCQMASISSRSQCVNKFHLKICAKWCLFCWGLSVLTHCGPVMPYGDIEIG